MSILLIFAQSYWLLFQWVLFNSYVSTRLNQTLYLVWITLYVFNFLVHLLWVKLHGCFFFRALRLMNWGQCQDWKKVIRSWNGNHARTLQLVPNNGGWGLNHEKIESIRYWIFSEKYSLKRWHGMSMYQMPTLLGSVIISFPNWKENYNRVSFHLFPHEEIVHLN